MKLFHTVRELGTQYTGYETDILRSTDWSKPRLRELRVDHFNIKVAEDVIDFILHNDDGTDIWDLWPRVLTRQSKCT